jgi:hypothetical protein
LEISSVRQAMGTITAAAAEIEKIVKGTVS